MSEVMVPVEYETETAEGRLWLVFAHERPDDWKQYHGCGCMSCKAFRTEFRRWLAARADRLEAENVRLRATLRYIADLGGNLADEHLTGWTGPNDAAHRGLMYTEARRLAVEALVALGERSHWWPKPQS